MSKSCCLFALSAVTACAGHEAEQHLPQPPAAAGSFSGGSHAAGTGGAPAATGGTAAGADGGANAAFGGNGSGMSGAFAGGASELGDAWVLDNLLAIVLASNPLADSRAFTLQVLFRPDPVLEAQTALAEPRFVHIETDAGDRATVEARVGPTQFYLDTFIASAGRSKTLIDPARVHPVGAWHWAALTYADGVMRHYVDGAEDASANLDAVPFGSGKTSIGVRQNRVYWFNGCVRELRFVGRALGGDALERPFGR